MQSHFWDKGWIERALPLHETHTIEVDAVENKKAHLGVLKGCFLKGEERRGRFVGWQESQEGERGKKAVWQNKEHKVAAVFSPCVHPRSRRAGVYWSLCQLGGLQHPVSCCGHQEKPEGCILWNGPPETSTQTHTGSSVTEWKQIPCDNNNYYNKHKPVKTIGFINKVHYFQPKNVLKSKDQMRHLMLVVQACTHHPLL